MAKNIQVNLTFTADTNAAKQLMALLQQLLSNLAATPINATPGTKMALSLQQATLKAVELKIALNNATNVDTGKLNFNKFSLELKRNKTSLLDYAMQLKKLGPEGAQAFSQLANSIRLSETPLISLLGKAAALGKTLANTARWMISSSMLQGVMSAFTGTIDYAKELNKALTDIRIVTGKSADDMSKFAKEANLAAKALSATTKEYAEASLIYFQLGLNNSEVLERTETTLKLAKVVGESASTVSEWMTSIWNNFDDGSLTLEYYADVLAKLGAATASSADEIAGGIEKFSAVAETVGLSYEYAAAALATITAETRQSEDVVGTSLKTIFARIENLKLGETLEDGTDLGLYSEALMKVGVNIKDGNGELRMMDDILNDIGSRWKELNKDEQVALAQSVAGIRLYNQFMSLMSNWDVMELNVQMAKESNGALETLHMIWESGIEGATSRVQNNLEEIKNSLLGENDLLPLLNMADGFLTVIGDLIDSLGGLPGLLTIIASLGLKIYGPLAASMLLNMVGGIQSLYGGLTGKTAANKSAMVDEATHLGRDMLIETDMGDEEATARSGVMQQEIDLDNKTKEALGKITEEYRLQLEMLREIIHLKQEAVVKDAKKADDLTVGVEEAEAQVIAHSGAYSGSGKKTSTIVSDLKKFGEVLGESSSFALYDYRSMDKVNTDADALYEKATIGLDEKDPQKKKLDDARKKVKEKSFAVKELLEEQKAYEKLHKAKKAGAKLSDKEEKQYNELREGQKDYTTRLKTARSALKDSQKAYGDMAAATADADKYIEKYSQGNDKAAKSMRSLVDTTKNKAQADSDLQKSQRDLNNSIDEYGDAVDKGIALGRNWTQNFVDVMLGVASVAAGILMAVGAIDSLSSAMADGTASFSDYLTAITSVLFALPMVLTPIMQLVGWLGKFKKALDAVNKSESKNIIVKTAKAIATKLSKKATLDETKEEKKATKERDKGNASILTRIFFNIAEDGSKGPKGWAIAAASAVLVAGLIGAAIAVSAAGKKEENEEEANIEENIADLEAISENQELAGSIRDLTKEYRELSDAGLDASASLNELKKQVPDLILSYKDLSKELGQPIDTTELEGAWALVMETGDMSKFQEALDKIDKNIALTQQDKALYNADAAAEDMIDAAREGDGKLRDDGKYEVTIGGVNTLSDIEYNGKKYKEEDAASAVLTDVTKGTNVKWEDNKLIFDTSTAAGVIEGYETMLAAKNKMEEEFSSEELSHMDTYRELKRELNEMAGSYEALSAAIDDTYKSALALFEIEEGKEIFKTKDVSGDTYAAQRASLIKELLERYKITSEQAEIMLGQSETYKEDEKRYLIFNNKENLLNKDITNNKNLEINRVKEWYDTLDDKEKTLFMSLDFKTGDLNNLKEQMDNAIEDAKAYLASNSTETLELINDDFISGKLTSDTAKTNENYLNMLKQMDSIKEYYPELTELAEIFANEGLIGTETWTKAFYELKEQLSTIKLNKLKDDAAKAGEALTKMLASGKGHNTVDIEANLLSDKFENKLKDFTSKDYAINVEIHAQAEEAFSTFETATENLSKLANKIGEGYKVAASDIYELNEAFPGIIANMQLTEDGSILLNETIAKNAMDSANMEIAESARATISKLEDLRDTLKSKLLAYLAMAEIAQKAQKGELEGDEAATQIKALLTKLNTLNDKEASETELKNAETVATDSNKLALIVADNWNSSYKSAALSAADFARTAVEAAESATSGTNKVNVEGRFNVNYKGSNGAAPTVIEEAEIQEKLDADDVNYLDLEKLFKESADILGKQINSIDGMIAQIGATTANAGTAFGNISKGGKGGGGSNSKKETKNLEDEIERYHEIKEEMDDLARATEKAAKAKEHAFGDDKIKAIDKEIAAIDKEVKAYDKLIAENETYLKQDKANLSKYGVKFDAEGRVSNYKEAMGAQVAKYNKAVADFNAGNLSEEAFEKYEEDYELFKEYLEQYEETLNEYESNIEARADKVQEQIDKRLEKIDTIVTLNIDVNDTKVKALERLLKKLDDDLYDGAERVKNMTKQMEANFASVEQYTNGIAAVLKDAGATQELIAAYLAGDANAIANLNLTQEEIDLILTFTDGAADASDAIDGLRIQIEEQVMTTFTAWHEEIEQVGESLSSFNSILENFRNIIDTIGKDRLGIDDAVLADMEAASMGTLNAQVSNAKAQLDFTKESLAKAKEELAKAQANGDESSIKMWEDTIKQLDEQMITDAENFTSIWSEAVSKAGEIFEAQMDRAFTNFEKLITGIYGSLDKMSESLEKQQTLSEKFLDPSKKLYEISKLNRQIQKDIDKTDNVRSQLKLLEIQEMLHKYEKEGVQMSLRDLDALQKRYELKLAEIALEDAQNAKSQVRLQRDSEGNFGYVYTADLNAVADAQLKYEDALNANRELAVSQQQELINSIVSNRQAMVEALREIRIEDYEDTAAYELALAECAEYYTGLEAYYVDELNKVIERSLDIYENDFLAYDGWNLSKISSTEYLNEALGTADSGLYGEMGLNAQGWVDGFGKQMEEMGFEKGHLGTVKNGATLLRDALGTAGKEGTLFGDIHKNAVTWQSNIDTVMDKAGTSMEDFKKTTEKAMYGEGGTKDKPTGGVVKATEEAAKKTENLKKTALDMFNSTSTKVGEWQKAYSNKVDAATTSVNNLADAIAKLKDIKINFKFDADGNLIIEDGNKPKPTNPPPAETPKITEPLPASGGDGVPKRGDKVRYVSGNYMYDSGGTAPSGSLHRGGEVYILLINPGSKYPYHIGTSSTYSDSTALGWVSLDLLEGYDTGGYTGEWGPNGRLALLHQKEIVLNAHDTENLLTAVSMIREISALLESNALAMRYLTTVDNYNAALKTAGDTLQQEVTIHAEFPNATNHSEIEEAFRNLNNLASQYANRK